MKTIRGVCRVGTSVRGILVHVEGRALPQMHHDLDPITGMATYCAIPVTLEPASAGRG